MEENQKSTLSNFMSLIYVIYLILFLLGTVALLIFGITGTISFVYFIIAVVADVVSLTILYTINYTLNELEKLKKELLEKKIVELKDPDAPVVEQRKKYIYNQLREENTEDVTFCKKCGYKLFKEDKECPNCHKKVNDKKN